MSPSIVWQKLFTRVFKLFFPNRLVFLWLYLHSDLAPRHYWRLRCRKSCARRGLEPERGIWAASCCGAGEHAGTLPGANPGAGNSWWGEGVALLVQNRVVSSQGTLQCPSVMDQSLAWWPSEQLRLVHRHRSRSSGALCHNKGEMPKGRHYLYSIQILSDLEDRMDHNALFLSCTCLCFDF